MAEQTAFSLLTSIRDRAATVTLEGGDYASQPESIKNVAFVINGVNFYCDAKDVKEISTCQNLVVVPQTKLWMRGLINSKGVLYSVNDLALFAGFERPIQESRGHLLLLSDQDKQCALLVNRVIGFRYFEDEDKMSSLDQAGSVPDGVSAFVTDAHQIDGEVWFRMDVERLIDSEQFREVQ